MIVANIQRFSVHDGPGVRTTVFMKGCPLRCLWCHNPETQSTVPQILFYEKKCIGCGECKTSYENCPTGAREVCGTEYTTEALLNEIKKDISFYGKDGGVTFSGGEPFLQFESLNRALKTCKANGISTAIETCGFFRKDFLGLIPDMVDLLLWDVKDTNNERHIKHTGVSNKVILENLAEADRLQIPTRVRCILVNGVNAELSHYEAVAEIVKKMQFCEGVEFLPYHTYGEAKSKACDVPTVIDTAWIPTDQQVEEAKAVMAKHGIRTF